jgi:hypothetical protein
MADNSRVAFSWRWSGRRPHGGHDLLGGVVEVVGCDHVDTAALESHHALDPRWVDSARAPQDQTSDFDY